MYLRPGQGFTRTIDECRRSFYSQKNKGAFHWPKTLFYILKKNIFVKYIDRIKYSDVFFFP